MTFNPEIPQSGDKPTQSQGDLLANFRALNTVFDTDHRTFNAVDGGEHKKVTLNSVIGDPAVVDPKCYLYTKTVAGDSELFFEKYDNAAVAALISQMTNLPLVGVAGRGGYQTPWGLKINFGNAVIPIAGAPILFAIPHVGVPFSLQLTTGNSVTATQQSVFSGLTNLGFTVTPSWNNILVYYFSIGR